jgi:hypothetical protein
MPDNLENRGEPDRSRIHMDEDHEVRYWTQTLGVTAEQLADAVRTAGNNAQAVRAHLARNR